jgi:hypothetical protein
MSDHESHCPFLNRADRRCSNHFSLDKLDQAFDHCFGKYQACGTYQEMLGERRWRQSSDTQLVSSHAGLTGTVVYANLTIRKRPANVTVTPVVTTARITSAKPETGSHASAA